MKKRLLASVIIVLVLLPTLCLTVFADGHVNEGDITQNTDGVKPDGYEYAFHYIDYDKGVTGDEINRLDAVYIMHVSVFSDYAEQGLAEIPHDSALYPSYTKYLSVGGIPDNAPYNDPNYLGEQLFEGVTIQRDKENDLKDFIGQFYFTNDDAYVNWTDDYELNKVWYQVRYNYWADVSFSISNVVFDNNGISMDIDGEQSYRYEVVSEMHDSYPAGQEVPDSEREAFAAFKAKTDRKKGAEETRRTISVKGAKASFVLYDLENSNDKNLLLKVEGGGIRLLFNVLGVIGHTGAPISPGVTQKAENNPGEDSGVSVPTSIVEGVPGVPAAIVIGVLGGGAAIAGAAAAAFGSTSSDDRKRKSYKMYVQKDFGDAIRRGGEKPVKIRARMAEVDEAGTEHDRNDLTGNINVSADGMTVHGAALVGRYCEATVSVPKEYDKDNASITFTFTGEGGVFINTVIFRIVDGPSLKFIDERDGTLYHENCGIDAIPGDGFTYTERFAIVDAPTPPKLSDITAVNTGEFDVEFALTDQPAVYKMTVKNNTKPNSEHDIFAKVREERFEIHVIVEGEKEPVKGYVTMNLYPEGITVSSRDEGKKKDIKYVRVQAYEKDNAGDLDKKWQVSEIKFTLAHKGKDKAIIDPKEAEYRFEKLKGAGGKGTTAAKEQAIAEKYGYKESYGDWNGKFTYTFEPQDRLWEPDNGTFFMTLLPVTCEYDGVTYKDEIPLRLRGKDMDPMEAWEKEYEKTRERIEKFSLPEQKAYNLQQLEKIASNDTCRISTWELRLMAKDVVRAYMKYWTEQNEKDKWNAAALDWTVWGLEWVKWIGDCAFSYVVAAYTGPLEAIITPAKDVFVNAIGEVGVNIVWGTKFDVKNLEIYDQIKNAGDNFVSGGVADGVSWLASSGMSSPAKIKYACAIMGGYFVFAVFNNYLLSLEKGENDFYGAVMGAFKDMTVTALKIAASMMFKKWLESESFKKKIGPKLEEFMQKRFGEHLADQKFNLEKMYNESQQLYGDLALKDTLLNIDVEVTRSGIVEKYLTELFGMGGAWVSDNPDKAVGFWFAANGAIMFSFTLPLQIGAATLKKVIDVDILKVLSDTANGMFGWFYDTFFGGLPAADALMEIPKDPPLPPAKD